MKKITSFIVFVILLVQMTSIAHAFSDALHDDNGLSQSPLQIDGNRYHSNGSNISEHSACSQSCHGHSHFYIMVKSMHFSASQIHQTQNNEERLLMGLNHGPDSPPPDFS